MSDNWIRIIPEQPDLVPVEERQQRAILHLRTIVAQTAELRAFTHDQIVFVDCGGNFESVVCPSCGADIDIDSWQGWMDEDFDGKGFTLSKHAMSCCGAEHTLHELRYQLPQGFGRFEVSAMNPDVGELSEDQIALLEQILGCRVRIIYQHI
jgi:hypothetical protein